MNVSLYQVYGTRRAANPHARNHSSTPLLPARYGPRRMRRVFRSVARKAVVGA